MREFGLRTADGHRLMIGSERADGSGGRPNKGMKLTRPGQPRGLQLIPGWAGVGARLTTVRALGHLALAIAISRVATAEPSPGTDTPLTCQYRGPCSTTTETPGEPRRLDVLPGTVRVTLEGFKASRTKGKWLPVKDHRPLVVANESAASMPLADICSHPKGPAPRVTFSVKGPYLGYALSECKAFGADTIEVTVRCTAGEPR